MSVGVGRGRGRLPQQPNGEMEPLRRPNMAAVGRGRSMTTNPGAASKFSDMEAALSDPEVDTVRLFKVLDDLLQANPSSDDLDVLVRKVLERGVRSEMNVDCACQCLYLTSKHLTLGDQLYVSFFSQLEKKFTGMEALKETTGPSGLWRFRLMFSSVCQYVRNQTSPPFSDLVDGLNKLCLDMPQPSDANEARIAALSMARCCHYMRMSKSSGELVEGLLCKLRSMLRDCAGCGGSSDADTVAWLCLGLETACLATAGTALPPSTLQHYCRTLGPAAAAFNLLPPPAINLPASSKPNYKLTDISYLINYV